MKHYRLVLSFSVLFLTSCGAPYQLKQANDTYLLALEVAEALQPRLYELNQHKNSLNIQGRALFPAEIEFIRAVETIEDAYQEWKNAEIPPSGADARPGARRLLTHQKEWLAEIQGLQQKAQALVPPN